MVTINNADKVLKEVYLAVLSNQLDSQTNAFYNMIQKGSQEVQAGYANVVARYGINGGIGSPAETADLPKASSNTYVKFRAEMRNIYGTIEISDKALRTTSNNPDALVNVLNDEMSGLLEAAKFNFARMLFQTGNGALCIVGDTTDPDLAQNCIPVDTTKNAIEGMLIDVVGSNGQKKLEGQRIIGVERGQGLIKLAISIATYNLEQGDTVTLQDSYNSEIYGIPYIFDKSLNTLYGAVRINNPYLYPTQKEASSISSDLIQQTLDDIEEAGGSNTNLIVCSYDVRRAYFAHLAQTRMNIDYMNLDGGFKALSYNGIPVVADRFAPNKNMYFLNTNDFKLVQLNDWSWLEGSTGKVLRQMDNKAVYTATLVKYANLVCSRPIGQGMIKFQ